MLLLLEFIPYITIFLFGIVVGSFLNVCIYRLPERESIVKVPSHCMSCGAQLRWFDLIPLFSWLFLRGRCRRCKAEISVQYPIIEGLNGFLWVFVFLVNGMNVMSVVYCLMTSALLVLSVIDWRTFEIPWGTRPHVCYTLERNPGRPGKSSGFLCRHDSAISADYGERLSKFRVMEFSHAYSKSFSNS